MQSYCIVFDGGKSKKFIYLLYIYISIYISNYCVYINNYDVFNMVQAVQDIEINLMLIRII